MAKLRVYIIAIVLFVGGVFCIGWGISTKRGIRNAEDLKYVDSFHEGQWVKGTIDWCCGSFAYFSSSDKSKDESYRFYLIIYSPKENTGEDGKPVAIAVKVMKKNYDIYEQLANDITGNKQLTLQGKISAYKGETKEVLKFRDSALNNWEKELQTEYGTGFKFRDQFDVPDYYIVLNSTKNGNSNIILGCIFAALGGVIFLVLILFGRRTGSGSDYVMPVADMSNTSMPYYTPNNSAYGYNAANSMSDTSMPTEYNNPTDSDGFRPVNTETTGQTDELSEILQQEDAFVAEQMKTVMNDENYNKQ